MPRFERLIWQTASFPKAIKSSRRSASCPHPWSIYRASEQFETLMRYARDESGLAITHMDYNMVEGQSDC